MKNRFLAASLGLLALFILVTAFFTNSYASKNEPRKIKISNADIKISIEKAKELAISHSKVPKKEAKISKIKLDKENRKFIYEIEFYTQKKRYQYDIDANTGEIISYNQKDLGVNISTLPDTNIGKTTVTNGSTDKTKADKTNYIGEEKAKEIAISRVSGAKRSDVVRIKLDKENGRVVYEGKILYNYTEYKFDIDALTGEILSWEVNRD